MTNHTSQNRFGGTHHNRIHLPASVVSGLHINSHLPVLGSAFGTAISPSAILHRPQILPHDGAASKSASKYVAQPKIDACEQAWAGSVEGGVGSSRGTERDIQLHNTSCMQSTRGLQAPSQGTNDGAQNKASYAGKTLKGETCRRWRARTNNAKNPNILPGVDRMDIQQGSQGPTVCCTCRPIKNSCRA